MIQDHSRGGDDPGKVRSALARAADEEAASTLPLPGHPSTRDISAYKKALLNDPCAYCGRPSTVIDHVVPRSRGGEDEWINFAGLCTPCNTRKKSSSILAYLVHRLMRFVVSRAEVQLALYKDVLADWRTL